MGSIATVTGTALVPGVSRNGRLYTRPVIEKMVARAQPRIAADVRPISMRTHHAAEDDSTRIVGKVTKLWVDETTGAAKFTAALADTPHARTIAALADNRSGSPFLRGVSIRGAWIGPVRREMVDGRLAECADDLEAAGLDLTAEPGVDDAGLDDITFHDGDTTESAVERHPITESVTEALVSIVETAPTMADTQPTLFADLGYRGERRWPLDSKAQAKASWLKLTEADTARTYTANQLKRVRERAKNALRRHGVAVTEQGWLVDPVGKVSEAVTEYMGVDPGLSGSFMVNVSNGPLTITVSSYCVDPHDLDAIARQAMAGACTALALIDPDGDGDLDVPGEDDTAADETAPQPAVTETEPEPDPPAPEVTAPNPVAEPTEEEMPAVSEPTTTPAAADTAATTPTPAVGGITLTDEQFQALLGRIAPPAMAAAESAPAPVAAPVVPAPVAVTETENQRIARLVAEGIAAQRTQIVQDIIASAGVPARKGLVESGNGATVTAGPEIEGVNADWPQKPLHQYTNEEQRRYLDAHAARAILGARA